MAENKNSCECGCIPLKEEKKESCECVCIPMNPDTDSNNLRTPIPIQSGHLFRSKADTP